MKPLNALTSARRLPLLKAALLSSAMLLAGCVTEPARIASTPTGRPEVTIATTDLARIKAELINDLVGYNYTVREDTPYRLVLARPTKGMESFGATLVTGNSYSTNPDRVADFTFATLGDRIRIVASIYWQTQMALGQIRTEPLNDAKTFNAFQETLDKIKALLEQSPSQP